MIDEQSKAYHVWKGFYGISYIEEHNSVKFLYYNDKHNYKWDVDNISIKDFGETHYLSWTEENGEQTKLIILELQPHRQRRLDWTIAPAKGTCLFWVSKWTEEGLYMVYGDNITNYALKVSLTKMPSGISLQVTELGEKFCIMRNWIIGYNHYNEVTVSLFDLKDFRYLDSLTAEEAMRQNISPTEQGENDEELE